jgi:AcrR family transcriptional regulator
VKQHKEDRRSQRTYRLVSSALAELLLEKPYDEILVQDILDRAGIGRTTFYAHYFDKADVLESILEQMLETFNRQIAPAEAGPGIFPSLALFRQAYQHQHLQHFQAIIRGHAGEHLWASVQTSLSRAIEQALATAYAEKRSPPIPLTVVSEYLAGAFLTLFKWWLEADMPYPPEQMESIFRQLALPGVWATIEGKRTGAQKPA